MSTSFEVSNRVIISDLLSVSYILYFKVPCIVTSACNLYKTARVQAHSESLDVVLLNVL